MLRDEVRAPDVDLTPKIGELGVEAADLRVHGLEPRAGVVEPGLQRLTLALAVVSSTAWNSACARDVRLLGPPLGVDRLLEVRAGRSSRPRPAAAAGRAADSSRR